MAKSNQDQLRLVMRQWSTGVSVVSTIFQGSLYGLTVSSFTSVSLEPQVVSISLTKSAPAHNKIAKAGFFGITILSAEQQDISELFARRITGSENRFIGLELLTLETGAPFIKGGLAFIDCQVIAIHDFGTNSLILGQVGTLRIGENKLPLVYYDQQYRRLQD